MRMPFLRHLLALLALVLASLGFAGTLTVTSPSSGDSVGKTATIRFNFAGATRDVKVTATATPVGSTVGTSQTVTVTPNANDHTGSGSVSLTFADNTQSDYTIVVSATETGNGYAATTLNVTVDAVSPKFLTLSPVSGGYVRSIIKIRASVQETNMDEWVVTVNGVQVPNNATGSTVFSADYDASSAITSDGAVTISIVAKDTAENQASKTISLTLDRNAPTIQFVYPTSTAIRDGSDVTVLVDFTDASSASLDRTGIDVIAKTTAGTYITRVTFVSLTGSTGKQRWTGRIRYQKGLLPSQFVLYATAVDKAGNVGVPQPSTVRYGS